MKSRITLTMDPEIARKAKRIAHARRTNVSALIEDLVRSASVADSKPREDFVGKWKGKLRLRKPAAPDPLFNALKKRYKVE